VTILVFQGIRPGLPAAGWAESSFGIQNESLGNCAEELGCIIPKATNASAGKPVSLFKVECPSENFSISKLIGASNFSGVIWRH